MNYGLLFNSELFDFIKLKWYQTHLHQKIVVY